MSNYPAGVSDDHPYFTDESEPEEEVEARRRICGCVEFSDGEFQSCPEHIAPALEHPHLRSLSEAERERL